jgi:uncharacterized protein (TIGR03067 family)
MQWPISLLIGVAIAPHFGTAASDQARMQGEWVATTEVRCGVVAIMSSLRLTIAEDRMTCRDARFPDQDQEVQFTLDPQRHPKCITFTTADGRVECIYTLEGDTLSICVGCSARPTEFSSNASNCQSLLVFKRTKR